MSVASDEEEVNSKPVSKRRGFMGCLGRGAIGLLIFVAILLLAGSIYQSVASASDARQYPPPGEIYDVGDQELHLYCSGEGSPTVVLEAGASSPGLVWYLVQEKVAEFTRVCSYDRPGFGWSEPASGPLSSGQVATLLHQLLTTAKVPGPYILVGHSLGGIYVRSYAQEYPSEVAGLVLVDSSHESQKLRFPPEYLEFDAQQIPTMKVLQLISPFGLLRAMRLWSLMIAEPPFPEDVRAAIWATMYRTAYPGATKNEFIASEEMLSQPDGPASLGDLPLIVLSANDSVTKTPQTVVNAIGQEAFTKMVQTAQELQQELAGLSTQGKLIGVKDSGHYIQWDQPGAVIDAIREVVEQIRQ